MSSELELEGAPSAGSDGPVRELSIRTVSGDVRSCGRPSHTPDVYSSSARCSARTSRRIALPGEVGIARELLERCGNVREAGCGGRELCESQRRVALVVRGRPDHRRARSRPGRGAREGGEDRPRRRAGARSAVARRPPRARRTRRRDRRASRGVRVESSLPVASAASSPARDDRVIGGVRLHDWRRIRPVRPGAVRPSGGATASGACAPGCSRAPASRGPRSRRRSGPSRRPGSRRAGSSLQSGARAFSGDRRSTATSSRTASRSDARPRSCHRR